MIDFRYHLVSLIAVFLAVALGIIIGTTALNEPILADIEDQVADLEQDKRALEDRTQQLQARVDAADAFEEAVGRELVDGTLTGRSVVFVVTDEGVTPEIVEEVAALVTEAGATVTGTVRLRPEYTDPSTASALQGYVTGGGLPTSVQNLPETDDTGRLVASVLAQVLVVPPGGATATDPAALSSVLSGLSTLDVLTTESDSVTAADHVVVLTGDQFTGEDAAERNDTLIDLVSALDAAGSGAVVSGGAPSAQENGLVAAIRDDASLASAVSTVDNLGSPAGAISTVLALSSEGEGTSGKYGTGEDTQPVPPVPAAAP